MPIVHATANNLLRDGPNIEVNFTQTPLFLKANPNVTPSIVKLLAQIDTGASSTVVQKGVLDSLGLLPIGTTRINTPSSNNVQCYQFDVSIGFPDLLALPSLIVTEAPLVGQNIQCLIGRDVLSLGMLVYSGFTNSFYLSF